MTVDTNEFREAYAAGLRACLREPGEQALHIAYELGRTAVEDELTVLDLAATHHDQLLAAVRSAPDAAAAERITSAAGEFFLESVSAFEMVRRGFREARDLALLERRHAAMLRQLSNFLADASLALRTPDSVQEALTLVAEQARELVGADCAVASVQLSDDDARPIMAASYSETDDVWGAVIAAHITPATETPVPLGGPTRMAADELANHPISRAMSTLRTPPRTLCGWLVAPLTGLDGRELGSIQLFDKTSGDFTELDEAVLRHVAHLASAAIERVQLYQRPR